MQNRPDVSAIVVNWNTRSLLERALRSLRESAATGMAGGSAHGLGSTKEPDVQVEVIVVDNGSVDGSAAMVRAQFPDACLIENRENRGFAAAVNQGMGVAQGRYLLLLNSDARLETGSVPSLVSFLDGHPEAAIVAPQLRYADGSVQSSRRRFPTAATAFVESTVLQRLWPNHGALRRYYMLDRPDNEPQEVDWLVGACLLVRREALEQVGPLDERYFMYSEEMDWCRRLKGAGWSIHYLPQAQVIHEYGKSSDQDLSARHIHFNESKCRYFARYHGPLLAGALRLFLFATFLLQLAEEGTKLALGHKPGLRKERLRTIWRVLRYQAPRLLDVGG